MLQFSSPKANKMSGRHIGTYERSNSYAARGFGKFFTQKGDREIIASASTNIIRISQAKKAMPPQEVPEFLGKFARLLGLFDKRTNLFLYKSTTYSLKFLMGFIKLERAALAFDIFFIGNHIVPLLFRIPHDVVA